MSQSNEKTSPRVASLAGRINRTPKKLNIKRLHYHDINRGGFVPFAPDEDGAGITIGEVKSVAASAKTQSPDKAKPAARFIKVEKVEKKGRGK